MVSCSFSHHNSIDNEYIEIDNIAVEITLIEPWARFHGGYSDVYIGRFRNENARIPDAPANKHEADASI